jgi:hypothetical protein
MGGIGPVSLSTVALAGETGSGVMGEREVAGAPDATEDEAAAAPVAAELGAVLVAGTWYAWVCAAMPVCALAPEA